MDDYETEVARQPKGPFTRVAERQLIRHVSEQWVNGKRYSSERNRRIALYSKWIGIFGGGGITLLKVIEVLTGKGY